MVISVGGCSAAAIQICKACGAKVICVVRSPEKKRRALELGADEALNSRETDVPEAVRDLTRGLGADCVIDGVGDEGTLKEGIDSLCHGGRLVILGYTRERYPLDPRQVAVHELEVIGTRSGGRQDTVEAIQFVADPRWTPIVTDTFPIERVEEAHRMMREAKALGRIVLVHE
jgi:D-arabinose 1-dehydrogenase-like Zn-dependent alcohol dehydrogenase